MSKEKKLTADVKELLTEKVNEVFLAMQEKLGIQSGDIYPCQAFMLEKQEENMAELISDVLIAQKEGRWF